MTSSSEPDAKLIAAARDGDQAAFEALYRRHATAVARVVSHQLRDPQRVGDAVQETFARALEALPRLSDPERFRPWLLSIASHTAIDARRAGRRVRVEQLDEDYEQVDPALGPDELVEIAELAALVRGAVAGLSRRDATAVGLVALGFGIDDVAVALAISRGAAKVALHRARCRLKTALAAQAVVG